MKPFRIFIVVGVLGAALAGCKYSNPSVMLRTPKKYPYDSIPAVPDTQYVIAKDDIINLRVMANDGIRLVDVIGAEASGGGNAGQRQQFMNGQEYPVEFDGTVKLPVIGRYPIAGLTKRQAEDSLEAKYASLYKNPYVQVTVTNRRVIIFPGGLGTAKVIPILYQNMTLFEALAIAGGIDQEGKAYRIKLIRGNLKKPYVFLIDASKMENIQNMDVVLQADDIIYVEPMERPLRNFGRDVAPWISLVTTTLGLALTIYTLTRLN